MTAATAQYSEPTITANAVAGLQVTPPDGRTAHLAVVDEQGNVIDQGSHISSSAYQASVRAYRSFLYGTGHIRMNAQGMQA